MFLSIGLCFIPNDGTSYDHDELYGSLLIISDPCFLLFNILFWFNFMCSDHEGGNVSSHTAHLVSYFS